PWPGACCPRPTPARERRARPAWPRPNTGSPCVARNRPPSSPCAPATCWTAAPSNGAAPPTSSWLRAPRKRTSWTPSAAMSSAAAPASCRPAPEPALPLPPHETSMTDDAKTPAPPPATPPSSTAKGRFALSGTVLGGAAVAMSALALALSAAPYVSGGFGGKVREYLIANPQVLDEVLAARETMESQSRVQSIN